MTVETHTTIDLNDVQAIEFECGNCHAKIAIPVANLKHPQITCMYCQDGKQWIIPGSRDYADLITFFRAFQWLAGEGRPKEFAMRLRVSDGSHAANAPA